MTSLNVYVNFNGKTEEAFEFYRSVIGGDFRNKQRFGETNQAANIPEHEHHQLMHIALPINEHMTLMGSDVLESLGHQLVVGNQFSLSLNPTTRDEATRLFEGLSADGTITMALQETFWGAYFGMFTDKFGIQWMVNCEEANTND